MSKEFSEKTRVQIPAILHLEKLGYEYIGNLEATTGDLEYDHKTNILTDVFLRQVRKLNPTKTATECKYLLDEIIRKADNDNLGRDVYNMVSANSGDKLIDFENPENNIWQCAAEFNCRNEESGDCFCPDITCFVNGLPLAFIEVKIPNNSEGIIKERNRMNERMANRKFRRFLNMTQLMIFSNNQEYDNENRVPIHGAFYASITKEKIFFNVFREQHKDYYEDINLGAISDEDEYAVLKSFNMVVLKQIKEYKTNCDPTSPTNRVLSSMLAKDRFLFLLRYGFAYVEETIELEDHTKVTNLQKHVMRYQQMFASYAIRRKLDEGVKSGIIWHTQGSGKTALAFYSVRSLTDFYAKKDTVPKFYFIVDRLDLMEQASAEFKERGLSVRTASKRKELMDDFDDETATKNSRGVSEIMVVNIQKFEEDHEKVVIKDSYGTKLQRVFFIDEAHRGYNPKGSFLANLLDADKNAVKIALTGTPLLSEERASWKVFGDYIDKYYYDKSIADGYTLKLMREDIETSYKEKLISLIEEAEKQNPEIKKKDFDAHKIIESDNYLEALMEYVAKDLRDFRIGKKDKTVAGMVVCETNPQARELYRVFCEQMEKDAASGDSKKTPLKAGLILHDEGDKKTRKDTIERFKKTEDYDLLIVNKMLLTGFDAHRLKRLYLTRKLNGHDLLQALTRVNRPYKDFKYGYVVDFADIKKNFEDTNDEYLRELNRTGETDDEDGQEGGGLGESILESKESIKSQLLEVKNVLFSYASDNAEEFRKQLDELESKEELYKIRRVLDNAKALSNQVRVFGDDELKDFFATKLEDVAKIPDLLSVVNKRIENLNLQERMNHDEDVSDMVNIILAQIEYEFKVRDREELKIIDNVSVQEEQEKLMREFDTNFDKKDIKYVNLMTEIKEYFSKKGFIPQNTADAKERIGYIHGVMKRIKELNAANNVLKRKYKDDERFVRIHKRIVEENTERKSRNEKPIISEKEIEIAENMNQLKAWIDQMVYMNVNVMDNEAAFAQNILAEVSERLLSMNVPAPIADKKFIRSQIANEYYEQYNKLNARV